MDTERVHIDTLSIDPANVRRHDARNLEAIKASLAKFGQQRPIVAGSNGVVVAGNGTLEAARALGWTEIDVVRTELTGAQATAFAIADNRTAELAEWEYEALATQLQALAGEGFDMDALGWATHELEPLLAADWSPPEVGALSGNEPGLDDKTIKVTAEEWETIDRAIAKVRQAEGDDQMSDGKALERICAAYLAEAG